MTNTVLIPAVEMKHLLAGILTANGFTNDKAMKCAEVFTGNSIDGIYTHGINRFARFVQMVKDGFVIAGAEASLQYSWGGIEQWNGNLGPGILNAIQATDNVMRLASQYGIGCVALSNTNHWMRGGTYGWQAAKAGYVFIGWTNTIANMPAWGAQDARLGNNPLVIALPYGDEAIVLDMAMSQFSFGAMEQSAAKGEMLKVDGGYNSDGVLTKDPSEILQTRRPLPIGYWKGAGLSLLLDILATVLSGGLSTMQITENQPEHAVSQVFIAIDISKLGNYSSIAMAIEEIITDYHQSLPVNDEKITFPGEKVLQTRHTNLCNGIPVNSKIWDEVLALK